MRAKQGQIQSYMRLQRAECRTTCFVVWRGGSFPLFFGCVFHTVHWKCTLALPKPDGLMC